MKILVYGATLREARHHYVAKEGDIVGERLYSDYGNGEQADSIIVIDPTKIENLEPEITKSKKTK